MDSFAEDIANHLGEGPSTATINLLTGLFPPELCSSLSIILPLSKNVVGLESPNLLHFDKWCWSLSYTDNLGLAEGWECCSLCSSSSGSNELLYKRDNTEDNTYLRFIINQSGDTKLTKSATVGPSTAAMVAAITATIPYGMSLEDIGESVDATFVQRFVTMANKLSAKWEKFREYKLLMTETLYPEGSSSTTSPMGTLPTVPSLDSNNCLERSPEIEVISEDRTRKETYEVSATGTDEIEEKASDRYQHVWVRPRVAEEKPWDRGFSNLYFLPQSVEDSFSGEYAKTMLSFDVLVLSSGLLLHIICVFNLFERTIFLEHIPLLHQYQGLLNYGIPLSILTTDRGRKWYCLRRDFILTFTLCFLAFRAYFSYTTEDEARCSFLAFWWWHPISILTLRAKFRFLFPTVCLIIILSVRRFNILCEECDTNFYSLKYVVGWCLSCLSVVASLLIVFRSEVTFRIYWANEKLKRDA